MVAFDGLQPAQVTPELMPNLAELAASGAAFRRHHAAFPTVTRANVATLVTGCHPGSHGLPANTIVAPEVDPTRAMPALEPQLSRLALEAGHVLLRPTLGDILSRHGMEYVAVGVGTSGNAYLQNPEAETSGGATIHPEFCLPRELHSKLRSDFGDWPRKGSPNTLQMARATDIFMEYVLAERNPAASLIWFSEPDSSQHLAGVGSDLSRRALGDADAQLGRVLRWLEEEGRAGETDVIVVSDHGYSTISGVVDVEALLRQSGFPEGGEPGGVIAAPNGGSVLMYVPDGDPDTCRLLAAFLMTQPWCGPLLACGAAEGIEGTVPGSLAGVSGARAPELTMSFKWESRANDAGFAGHVHSSHGAAGRGQHGSMSPHETRNVLFARGPSFKAGVALSTPSGNVDLAPTVLRILGVEADEQMDGRVLEEALAATPGHDGPEWSRETHEAVASVLDNRYRQEIALVRVEETAYLESGRAELQPWK